jgi:hypothetical protein
MAAKPSPPPHYHRPRINQPVVNEKRAPTAGCRGSRSPQRDKTNWAGARRETNYARLITLPSNPLGVLCQNMVVPVCSSKTSLNPTPLLI